ncbi:phage regulatory CII family protein [Acinetobacter towneri]|uniref:Rha family transcriptional regulator n=1 Tax=Acinetobacter towneri TaxID=202956 RepID=A0AB35LYC6_9GAMM|nr:phage regulatory CII family protein [Acinetobacter towneri]MDM1718062.1 Rha family transcriptional regulator [Acinetobacter towneri]MDM1734695.1 Rha family transcriptional regulator [Acinetobacter towneri]MDM1738034.1 Rha family transcriptional regulator [Acinetobacter towneri]MDM1741806.1 Rha family transcriptional regulator [Acinetobacter towneri]MDM1745248.1 Rha family transcriptional regulator [Acinetobacter towneri]
MRLTVNEKRKRAVMSLEMSLKAAVDSESDDSVMHRIAQKNGFNINTFRSSLNPTTPTHKANIYHLEAVLAETRDPRIMDSLCAIHGNAAWFELPEIEHMDQINFMSKIGKLAREQGVLAQSIAAALSDGSINNDELSVIRKDAYDLIRIAATLLAMAEKQYWSE